MNSRLRGAMLEAEVSPSQLASAAGVDVKTVNRWLGGESLPYPLTRARVARILGQGETFLWPSLVADHRSSEAALAELDRIWPMRSSVPSMVWHALFTRASRQIDILVYAGGFLVESLDLDDVLRLKSSQGAKIRVLVGDPAAEAVRARAAELSLVWLPERCASTLRYFDALQSDPRVDVRCHGTTLYASTFRFDDVLLVNAHAHGVWAAHSPTLQVSQSSSSHLFHFYAAAFESVWQTTCVPRSATATPPGDDARA